MSRSPGGSTGELGNKKVSFLMDKSNNLAHKEYLHESRHLRSYVIAVLNENLKTLFNIQKHCCCDRPFKISVAVGNWIILRAVTAMSKDFFVLIVLMPFHHVSISIVQLAKKRLIHDIFIFNGFSSTAQNAVEIWFDSNGKEYM